MNHFNWLVNLMIFVILTCIAGIFLIAYGFAWYWIALAFLPLTLVIFIIALFLYDPRIG